EPGQARRRYRRAFGNRTVYTSPDEDGMGFLCLHHAGLELAAVQARLEAMARALGADDPRSMDQRKADLAVDLLLGRLPHTPNNDNAAAERANTHPNSHPNAHPSDDPNAHPSAHPNGAGVDTAHGDTAAAGNQ